MEKDYKTFLFSASSVGVIALAVFAMFLIGREPWGKNNVPGLWSGDINSKYNSQFVADPYSFTHISHGAAFYALLYLIAPEASLGVRVVSAIALESGWEVFENTDFVINRYRAATISLDYYGDSIVNSVADILFMIIGFFLAFRLPAKLTMISVILLEIALALTIRDSLILNILMLVFPIPFIKNWQSGG